MRKKHIVLLTCVCVIVSITTGWVFIAHATGTGKSHHAQTPAQKMKKIFSSPRPVKIMKAHTVARGVTRHYPGVVEATRKVQLSFRVSGPLIHVYSNPGDSVTNGQVLMQIDPRDFDDTLRSVEASLSGARATSGKARADYQRARDLLKDTIISQAQYDAARAAYETARAQVETLEAKKISLQHSLKDTHLRAPFNGRITQRLVENHEVITAGRTVMRMQGDEEVDIIIDVPESDIPYLILTQGVHATATCAALPGKTFDVYLSEWDASASSATRTYSLTFTLKIPEGVTILPGMTAEVKCNYNADTSKTVAVPASALVQSETGEVSVWVFHRASGTAHRRNVRIQGPRSADTIAISGAIQPGDEVVIEGARFLRDGMVLTPVE